MPVHDWSRVDAGIFHHFHTLWLTELSNALNGGLLPRQFYALAEQHASQFVADVLTLHVSPHGSDLPAPSGIGSTAVAEAPPKARRRLVTNGSLRQLRRTLTIRHVSGHRLVALVEIVSPANKDRAVHVEQLATKIDEALRCDVHVLLVDLFAPGTHDPHGMHGAVWDRVDDGQAEPLELPPDEPFTLASYVAGRRPEAYIEHAGPDRPLPPMPLFLHPDHYITLPLEETYQAAFRGTPEYWRDVLTGRGPAEPA